MYESPITKIVGDIAADIVKREEDCLMESVHKVGFGIDKEELAKALQYDRGQYEKGFRDGRLSAEPRWIPCSERLPEENGRYLTTNSSWGSFEVDWSAWINGEWLYPSGKPVAWMPLPEPYERSEDAEID